jgi:hypothetical protein
MFTIYNFKCLVELISQLELSLEYIYISGDRKQLPVIGFENETNIFWGIVNHKIYEMDYKNEEELQKVCELKQPFIFTIKSNINKMGP